MKRKIRWFDTDDKISFVFHIIGLVSAFVIYFIVGEEVSLLYIIPVVFVIIGFILFRTTSRERKQSFRVTSTKVLTGSDLEM